MKILKTDIYEPLQLLFEQTKQVPPNERMQAALADKNCFGFYLVDGAEKAGFALLRKFEERKFFLWSFIIDHRHQGRGKGRVFLRLLLDIMKSEYDTQIVTTTYNLRQRNSKKIVRIFWVCADGCGLRKWCT
ncbi:MAG: GNAT family N-acetyltransferase [Defluviitaleaceae bacterium]|nr:GNAT family N-acetyltransferase [Defluviitaleaceae bacterium]